MVHACGLTTSHTHNPDPWLFTLTHYGLVTSYGDMDVGKHLLRLAHVRSNNVWSSVVLSSLTRELRHYRKATLHDDVIKRKHFPRYWPSVRGIHRSPVNSPHKGQWRFGVFFDLRLNKRLWKQAWGWWLVTTSGPLWRHCDDKSTSSVCCSDAVFGNKACRPAGPIAGVANRLIIQLQLSKNNCVYHIAIFKIDCGYQFCKTSYQLSPKILIRGFGLNIFIFPQLGISFTTIIPLLCERGSSTHAHPNTHQVNSTAINTFK